MMDPIPGFAELSCEFRDPDAARDAVVQGGEVELLVTIKSPAGAVKYDLHDAFQVFPEPASADRSQHAIRILQQPRLLRSYTDGNSYRDVDEYVVSLAIDSGAPPRNHDVKLTFSAPNRKLESRYIRFFIGAKDKGQFLDASATTSSTPSITAGIESPFLLTISNKFPTYRVALRRIEVSSDPEGLIEPFKQERTEDIAAGASKRVEVTVLARDSWWRHLWPIESATKLNVLLVYDDGYRAGIERLPQIPITFTLNASGVVIALLTTSSLLLGALTGTWLRSRFTTPTARGKKLPLWEQTLASLLLGGVIVAASVLAKIEIVAVSSSLHLPLHKPAAVVLVAFIVALYDPSDWVKTIRDKFRPSPAGSTT